MKLTYETLVRTNPQQILLPRFTVSQIMRNDQQVSFRIFFTANHNTFDKDDYIVVKYARVDKDGNPETKKGVIQYFKPKTIPVVPKDCKDEIIFGKLRQAKDGSYFIDWGEYKSSVVEDVRQSSFYSNSQNSRIAKSVTPTESSVLKSIIDPIVRVNTDISEEISLATPVSAGIDAQSFDVGDQHISAENINNLLKQAFEHVAAGTEFGNLVVPSTEAYTELSQRVGVQAVKRIFSQAHSPPNSNMDVPSTQTGTGLLTMPESIETLGLDYYVTSIGSVKLKTTDGYEPYVPEMPQLGEPELVARAVSYISKSQDQSEISNVTMIHNEESFHYDSNETTESNTGDSTTGDSTDSSASGRCVRVVTRDELRKQLSRKADELVDGVSGDWISSSTNYESRQTEDFDIHTSEILSAINGRFDGFEDSIKTDDSTPINPKPNKPKPNKPKPNKPKPKPKKQTKAMSRLRQVFVADSSADDITSGSTDSTTDDTADDLTDVGGNDNFQISDAELAQYDDAFKKLTEDDIDLLPNDLRRIYDEWCVRRLPYLDSTTVPDNSTVPEEEEERPDTPEILQPGPPHSHIQPFINHFAPGYDTVTGDLVWKVGYGFEGSFDTFHDYLRYIISSICKRVQNEITRRPGGNGKLRKINKSEIVDEAAADAQKRLYFRSNPGYVYCYWGHSTPRMIRLLQAPYYFRNHHCSHLYWYLVCATANSTEIRDNTYRILIGRHGFINRAEEIIAISYDSIVIPGNSFYNPMWIEVRDENDELYPLQVPYIVEWTFRPLNAA